MPEVVVEREGRGDFQPRHHRATHAIGEAPALVSISGEGPPRFIHVVDPNPLQVANLAPKNPRPDFERPPVRASESKEGQQFIDDVVGRDQRSGVRVQLSLGRRVVGIGGDESGEPSSGIDEDAAHRA